MGLMASLDVVPSDYKIKYIDSLVPSNIAGLGDQFKSNKARTIRVKIAKDIIEDIYWPDADLTVGWLLSEVTRQYDKHFDANVGDNKDLVFSKKLIVGLKTTELMPALDYYLTFLDNWLRPIKSGTLLAVHYSKLRDGEDLTDKSFRKPIWKDDFHFLKVLGWGGYANVVLARKRDSGRLYAIKIIKKDHLYVNTIKRVYTSEAHILKKLTGQPFIIGTHYTFQTDTELYFVMDPCIGGTLFHLFTQFSKGTLNEEVVKFYLAEIIIALEKIHSKNIIYRDLKPENILIDIDGHVKLSDFGLSKQLKKRDELSTTFWGSPEYLPPEMLYGYMHSRAVDFYTLGWLMYEMIVGFPPFHSQNKRNLEKRIMSGVIRFPNNMSADAQDLIEWLLAKNPSERPEEVSEIKKHHYFNSIHWGRIAKKQAIPPWIPDLNKWHAPKKFTSIPLNTVFLRENKGQKFKSASYNPRPDEGQFKTDIYAHDQKSNMVHREYNRREAGNDLYLDGKYFLDWW
jgi:serine/threonine protein kinase